MEFRVLGALEAVSGGKPVELGHARQRYVLAVLLAEANRPVSLAQLADRVWGERLPHRMAGTLRSYISRLRSTLADAGDFTIERVSGGYVLRVDPGAVDLHQFRDLAERARATRDDHLAAELFADALALWRGEAFDGLDTAWLSGIRSVLDAERHAAELDHHDVRLRLGQHAGLVSGLSQLAERYPLDERLAGQLVLALYRSGRQADALAHYEDLRRRLADGLGADPSGPLRQLYQRMLNADTILDVRPPEPVGLAEPLRLANGVETFLMLARERSPDLVAERLNLSEQDLLREIRELERMAGGALFKHGYGTLTELGEHLLAGASPAYDRIVEVLAECRSAAREVGGTLRIGYLTAIGTDVVAALATRFETAHPECRVVLNAVSIWPRWDPETVLREAELDLVLHWSPGGDGRTVESDGVRVGGVITSVQRGVLMPADHPLAAFDEVSLEDIADYEVISLGNVGTAFMRDRWAPQVTPSGRPIKHTTDDVLSMTGAKELVAPNVQTLVARGYGLHFTVASLLDKYPFPGLKVVAVRDMPPMVVVPVWRKAAETAAILAFAEIATAPPG